MFVTNLSKITFVGSANSTLDETYFCITGGSCYAMSITDGVLDLSKYWTWSEFNVFGYADGSEADFNNGSSITIVNTLNVPTSCIPASAYDGETEESNDLFLVTPCTVNGDSAYFTENETDVPPSVTITPSSGAVDADGLSFATFNANPSGGTGDYLYYYWTVPSKLSKSSGCSYTDSSCTVTSTDHSATPYKLKCQG